MLNINSGLTLSKRTEDSPFFFVFMRMCIIKYTFF